MRVNFKKWGNVEEIVGSPAGQEDVVVGVIYQTKDLSKFKVSPMNRDINEGMVREITKGLIDGKDLFVQTIEVFEKGKDGKHEIADGNHRYMAACKAQEMGSDVSIRYTVIWNSQLKEQGITKTEYVQKINNDRKQWSLEDFVYYYIKDDTWKERQANYKKLLEFCEKYYSKEKSNGEKTIMFRYGAALLSGGKSTAQKLKDGVFEVALNDELVEYRRRQIEAISQALGINMKNNFVEAFIKAWFWFITDPECQTRYEMVGFKKFLDVLSTEYNTEHGEEGKRVNVGIAQQAYWQDVFSKAVKNI